MLLLLEMHNHGERTRFCTVHAAAGSKAEARRLVQTDAMLDAAWGEGWSSGCLQGQGSAWSEAHFSSWCPEKQKQQLPLQLRPPTQSSEGRDETASCSSEHSFCTISMVDTIPADLCPHAVAEDNAHLYQETVPTWARDGAAASSHRLLQRLEASSKDWRQTRGKLCDVMSASLGGEGAERQEVEVQRSGCRSVDEPHLQDEEGSRAAEVDQGTLPRPRASRRKLPGGGLADIQASNLEDAGLSGAALHFGAALKRRDADETAWLRPLDVQFFFRLKLKTVCWISEEASVSLASSLGSLPGGRPKRSGTANMTEPLNG